MQGKDKTSVTVLATICSSRCKAHCSGNGAKNVLPTPAGVKCDSGHTEEEGAGFAKLYTLPAFFSTVATLAILLMGLFLLKENSPY